MPTMSRVYLSERGLGDEPRCIELLQDIARHLDTWNLPTVRVHYSGELLLNLEDSERALIDDEKLFAVSQHQFPGVWLIINYDSTAIPDALITDFESTFGLQIVKKGPTYPDRFEGVRNVESSDGQQGP